jgi:hypothetical protein
MDELIIVKRTRNNNQFMSHKPLLKISDDGRHHFSNSVVEILRVKHGDGVMFAFNNKEGKGYIFKDEDPEAFIVKCKSHERIFRFCAKHLITFFEKAFNSKVIDYQLFTVSNEPVVKNGQQMYELTLYLRGGEKN